MDYRYYRNILTDKIIVGIEEPFHAVSGALQLSGANSA